MPFARVSDMFGMSDIVTRSSRCSRSPVRGRAHLLAFTPMLDTSREAARVQAEVHRRLGPDRRVEIALELSEALRELACDRIRAQFPELDEIGVRNRLVWELYGVRLEPR